MQVAVVEPGHSHAVRFLPPYLRIASHRPFTGQGHLEEQLDPMARGHNETQAASKTRLLARRNFFYFGAIFLDPARKRVEVGLARDLEPGIVHPRHISLA